MFASEIPAMEMGIRLLSAAGLAFLLARISHEEAA